MRPLILAALVWPIAAFSSELTITTDWLVRPTCTTPNGIIQVFVLGGVPPVNIAWSDGVTGTTYRDNLAAGTYTLTATDAVGNTAVRTYELEALPNLYILSPSYIFDGSLHFPCPGMENGSVVIGFTEGMGNGLNGPHGVPPFTINMQVDGAPVTQAGTDGNGNPWFANIGEGTQLTYDYTDAVGCSMAATWIAEGPTDTTLNIDGTTPACLGASNGSIEVGAIYELGGVFVHFIVRDALMNEVLSVGYDGPLPDLGYFSIEGLATGEYTIETIYDGFPPGTVCDGYITGPVFVGELPVECGIVQGTLFIDHDQDCVQGPDEAGIPGRIVEITPGPVHAITDQQGRYTRSLPNGAYALQVLGADLWPLCPAATPVPFTIDSDVVTVDLADSSVVQLDLATMMEAGPARPGFVHDLWMEVRNLTAQASGGATVTLTFDPTLSFISAQPMPTSITGNVLTWDLAALPAYAAHTMGVALQVPADPGLLGTSFSHEVSCTQPITESNVQNNAEVCSGIFTGSYDPNDKTARTSSRTSEAFYVLDTDDYIDYVIRFQNTGTDTAFTVVVTDTLDQDLDIPTFQQGIASHPYEVRFKPGRVVEWRFADILLPDSNTNEPLSHGLVTFRIAPVGPVLAGTEFRNNADIFFDFNPPVRTNDAVLVAVNALSIPKPTVARLDVFPNPAVGRITLLTSGAPFIGEIRITTIDGRVVHRQRASNQVDVTGLAPGVYGLSLSDPDGGFRTTRFVKQ